MSLKFEIYRSGERLKQYTPVNAMAIGPESVPWTGSVTFKDGYLVVSRGDDHATGVSLLWDMGPRGAYQMETTRLPPSQHTYLLNVELARFRLMKIVQKQEDWNLFDFPKTEIFQSQFRDAQGLFAQALAHLDKPAVAAKLADLSLDASMELGEKLAHFHADLLLNRRRVSNAMPRHLIGCRVDWTNRDPVYREKVAENCDFVVLPMPWKLLQPNEDTFDTKLLDEWVEMLARKRVMMLSGPLVDLSEANVPRWLYIWEHDFETLRDLAYDYVRRITTRYHRAITAWNVVSGLHATTQFSLSFEQMIELTRVLVQQVRSIAHGTRTIVSITQPFCEYHAQPKATVPPMLYAEMVAQSGITFDAFALEWEMGVPRRSQHVRDFFQISSMLDRFSTLGKPLFLTNIGVPGRSSPDPRDQSEGTLDPSIAGRWMETWSPARQAKWLEEFARIAFSKPYIENITWSSLCDQNASLPGGGFLDESLQPKPVIESVRMIRETFVRGPRKP